jgi:endonuclease/exonuclease/phosphatase family metal-dependent hydrolase
MGDLNEWYLWGPTLRWLHAHFQETPSPATFPTRFPLFALDRIWVKPRRLLRQLTVHRTPLARIASDHLPVTAELDREPVDALEIDSRLPGRAA